MTAASGVNVEIEEFDNPGSSEVAMRLVRGIFQSLCIILLLLTCSSALSAERRSVACGILSWFTAPGQTVQVGKAFTTFLSRMATR